MDTQPKVNYELTTIIAAILSLLMGINFLYDGNRWGNAKWNELTQVLGYILVLGFFAYCGIYLFLRSKRKKTAIKSN